MAQACLVCLQLSVYIADVHTMKRSWGAARFNDFAWSSACYRPKPARPCAGFSCCRGCCPMPGPCSPNHNVLAGLCPLCSRDKETSNLPELNMDAFGHGPESIVGAQYSPRYHVPEPHDVEPRNIHIEGLLKSLSEKAHGWVSPDSLNQDVRAELTRLVKPGTLFQFLLDRPWDFEVTAKGYEWNAFRVIAHTQTVQPVKHLQLVGNCTCDRCWPHWFEEGWTCRGLAKQAG